MNVEDDVEPPFALLEPPPPFAAVGGVGTAVEPIPASAVAFKVSQVVDSSCSDWYVVSE